MISLYCFGESGNAYKVALQLELSGIAWEPVYVDFFNGETRTSQFRKLNPMGEVPVLKDGDYVLTESGAIQDYIFDRSGLYGGSDALERRDIWRWVLWDNHKLSSIAGTARFLSNFVPPEKRPDQTIKFLKRRLNSAFKVLESELDSRHWLVGGSPTMADLSCCGYLYYPEPFGFDRTEWPAIDSWLNRIANLDGWKHPYDLMPGHPSDRN